MKYTIGFDLGGTKLAAALVREDGVIVEFIKLPVNMKEAKTPKKAQQSVVEAIVNIALDFKQRYPRECSLRSFKGVGLASAGPMDVENGLLIYPANFPGWKVVPLRKNVESGLEARGFKTSVSFQNDAMAAAMAEGWVGGAKKMSSYAVITVGTGIGSGVIVNGRPCQTRGAGSEFGHSLIQIEGRKKKSFVLKENTVEGVASGTGLLRRAKELGFKGKSVEELALESKRIYHPLYDDMAWALAGLCYNLSIGFNLEGIFISGGLIKIRHLYFKEMVKTYRNLICEFNSLYSCPIKVAKTQNKAGVLGAAYLPWIK